MTRGADTRNLISAALEEGELAVSHGGHMGIPSPQALPSARHAFLNLSKFMLSLPFLKNIFIYFFDCTGSWLQPVGSNSLFNPYRTWAPCTGSM